MEWAQIATNIGVPILGAALGYFGVRGTSRRSQTVGKEANAITFSRDLLGRVDTLEENMRALRAELNAVKAIVNHATGWIEHTLRWISGGRVGLPPRITDELRQHLDPWVLEEYERSLKIHGSQTDTDNARGNS